MTDIVDRLNGSLSAGYSELRKEAAVTITRLRASLEAAEKERDDAKAAAENIALKLDYLRSKLETAEHTQNDWLRANAPGGWIDNLRIENEALRAKVEQMERQQFGYRERCTPSSPAGGSNRFPLYTLSGAKGE